MTDTMAHRGPNADGVFFDRKTGVGLGHRRLSILDLTDAGSQPMWSHSGRYCIAYNGEVYNAPEVRADLEAQGARVAWRGHSDTEVVVEAIEALGLERALQRFSGMFAFALWEQHTRRLFLVRDRLGIKPLLYTQSPFGVAFSSELQALYALPSFQPKLDRSAVASFLRYGVVPGNECIVHGVQKVQAGTIVEFVGPRTSARERCYWSAADIALRGLEHPFEGDEQEAIDELERALRHSVELRMRSDVPFGAFLSGGIDSSTVASLMQQLASTPVKTFTIGNTLSGYDESKHAEAVAAHLGCDHHTLVADPSDMLAIVPDVARHWDEPFADSSQIPTLLVSRLTRQHVTVSLSGDGGDELFGGYNRHAWAPRLWRIASRLPVTARKALGLLEWIDLEDWDRAFRSLGLGEAVRLPGDKLHKIAALAEVDTAHGFYERLRSHWVKPWQVLEGGENKDSEESDRRRSQRRAGRLWHNQGSSARDFDARFAEQMMLYDLTEYLPEDILTKVDRASMSASLEARVPLLDHAVVELAWRIPLEWKIRDATQKWILRQVLERQVPRPLFERAKMGFGVPVGHWLRGALKDWAMGLLDENRLSAEGIFEPKVVKATWNEQLAGRGNHEHRLWAILMFQSWWETSGSPVKA